MSNSPHPVSSLLCCSAAAVHPAFATSDAPPSPPSSSRSTAACATSDPPHNAPSSTLLAYPRRDGYLPASALQPLTRAQQHPGQLRFREELMHELLKQLPVESTPRKRGAGLHPAHALAAEHFSVHADEERDCSVCSRQPEQRKRTRFACSACNAHLCLGHCFARYHS